MIDRDHLMGLIEMEDTFFSQNPQRTFWEDYEMGLLGNEAKELLNAKLVAVVYRSRSTTGYRTNRENISQLIKQYDTMDTLFKSENGVPPDLFKSVVGYDDVKTYFMKIISSQRNMGAIMIGPPASAKSMFLMELSRLPRSRYITASSATKAGLSDILIEYEPDILLVDELDKANPRDYDTLLSLMEDGIVQKNHHSMHIQKVLHTKVFAAANRDTMPPEIHSRFITLRFRKYTEPELREIGSNILTMREHVAPDIASMIVDVTMSAIPDPDPRDFLKIARLRKGDQRDDVEDVVKFMQRYS